MIHPKTAEILAYGDSFGLPYETRTKREISDLGGVLNRLLVPDAHSDFKDFEGMPAGTWSDDTQHALVVCESIQDTGEYSLSNIALALKEEMTRAKGWGKTTKRAIARVHEGMSEQQLANNGETAGNGCGPLMRSVPLVIYAFAKDVDNLERMAVESAGLTHNNPENMAATVAHHRILKYLLENGLSETKFLDYIYRVACEEERRYGAWPHLSDSIKRARNSQDIAGSVYEGGKWGAFTTWAVQAVSYEVFARYGSCELIDLLTNTVSEGGDADSTGAVVAGMWALTHQDVKLPDDINLLEDGPRLGRASDWLLGLFNSH